MSDLAGNALPISLLTTITQFFLLLELIFLLDAAIYILWQIQLILSLTFTAIALAAAINYLVNFLFLLLLLVRQV